MGDLVMLNDQSYIGRTHECTICGHRGPWGPGWEWYGSLQQIEDGQPVVKVCSKKCKAAFEAQRKGGKWR